MEIYVGNLPKEYTEEELLSTFSSIGDVEKVRILKSRDTGESLGVGFVTMKNSEDGEKAIRELDGQKIGDRTISVDKARHRRR